MNTEAEFAACLLECGPHKRRVGDLATPDYCTRVYNWYRKQRTVKWSQHHADDWTVFWVEYIKWVQS